MTSTTDDALAFFNGLSITLRIELDPPATQVAPHLLNLVAQRDAKVRSVAAEVFRFDEDTDDCPLTEVEWSRVVIEAPVIRLYNVEAGPKVEHRAPNGVHFTVRDLVAAIVETERQARSETEWCGGVDVHHIFFEGIEQDPDGSWSIGWGS